MFNCVKMVRYITAVFSLPVIHRIKLFQDSHGARQRLEARNKQRLNLFN